MPIRQPDPEVISYGHSRIQVRPDEPDAEDLERPTFWSGWSGPIVGFDHPGGAGCGCKSVAVGGWRHLAARCPATTRPLIGMCEQIAV